MYIGFQGEGFMTDAKKGKLKSVGSSVFTDHREVDSVFQLAESAPFLARGFHGGFFIERGIL